MEEWQHGKAAYGGALRTGKTQKTVALNAAPVDVERVGELEVAKRARSGFQGVGDLRVVDGASGIELNQGSIEVSIDLLDKALHRFRRACGQPRGVKQHEEDTLEQGARDNDGEHDEEE